MTLTLMEYRNLNYRTMSSVNIVWKPSLRQEGPQFIKRKLVKVLTCVKYKLHMTNEENSQFSIELPLDDEKFVSLQE